MKRIKLISAAVLSILAAVSCTTEIFIQETSRTVISANLASSKTAFGALDGTSRPNYWSTGDQISVNGVTSDALDAEADGKESATFTFEGALSTPYYAVYPAAAVSGYDAGSATLTMPATQNYVAGSYDPATLLMCGMSVETGTVTLNPCVAVIRLNMSGTAAISRIKLTGAAEAALSGTFTTDFTTNTPDEVSNVVELVAASPVALPADFFICVPAGLSGSLKIDVFDSDGGSMSRTANLASALTAGKVFPTPELPYVGSGDITIAAEGITSSTAVICWDNAPTAAYTIGVYSDAGCSSIVNSYEVPAGDDCWGGETPRFCISGLAAGTTYYVKVTNVTLSADSNILPVTTEAFDIVVPDNTPADVDDVILAEDFGELRWDCDMIGQGAGFFPSEVDNFSNTTVDAFKAVSTSNEKILGSHTAAVAVSRLAHWAQGAKNTLYIHPGYVKLVGSKNPTHIVTPALNNIPDGKVATLEVEVTASRYYSASSDSYETDKAIVAVQPAGEYNELCAGGTNTLDLTSNIANITLPAEVAWNTFKVTLNGVVKGDRLAFGARNDIAQNAARMNLSDMKVTIKELYDAGTLTATAKGVSSSTAVFSWTHAGSASQDVSKAYTISLYRDSACTDLVVSHVFDANADCWDGKIPCFVFGGLNPNTEYWFVAKDTDADIESDPVSATTDAFTPVDPTTVTDAEAGDVILAEDFSEIAHGPDEFAVAAGFIPSAKDLTIPSGDDPAGVFTAYNNTGNRIFGNGWDLGDSRLSHGYGFFGNSSVYTRNGYLRICTTSTSPVARTHLVTPALSGIPDGKIATIKVTVTATKNESNENDVAVFVEKGLTMNTTDDRSSSSYKKYTGASLSVGHALGITTVREWETKSVNIDYVDNDCQLLIGSLNSIPAYNRFSITDVKVEILSLADAGPMEISDDASFLTFVNAVASNKNLDAIVTQDIELEAATISAFESIEDYAGTFDGDNYTITGLTKPLFATLEGNVQNLTLNSTISSSDADDPIWGILAKQLSSGSVSGCTAQGSITYSASSPSAQAYIGGVVGKYSGGTLSGCYNEASITYSATGSNKIYIGGVVSNNESKTLSDCHSRAGTISVTGYSTTGAVYVGGVVGYDSKTIDSCTNAMTVDFGGTFTSTSTNYWCAGGISGKVTGGSITNCLNTGNVIYSQKMGGSSKGYTFVGGLVGQIKGTISNSSNGGTVSFTGKSDSQNPYIGGIVGSTDSSEGSITGKYSTASATNYGEVVVNTSTQSKKYVYVGGIAGRLHTNNTITATNNGPVTITRLTCTQAFVGGLVGYSSGSTCTINSGSANLSGGVITITDLTGNGTSNWSAYIGGVVGQAKGAVEANNAGNLAINGLTAKLNACIGGIAGWNSAAVSGNNDGNVVISSGSTFTKSAHIGGIIGHGEGPVSSSTNNGLVSNAAPMNDTGGYLQVGGVVGYNNTPCTITDCHNTGEVTNTADAAGYLYVGGITSESDAAISDCTNTGNVSNSGDSGNGHPICIGGVTGVASANVTSSSNGTDTEPGGTISNTGNSAEDICIGGVIGWNNNKAVENCFNKGNVTNSGNGGNIAAGGVVGWSSASSSYEGSNTSEGTITNTGTPSTAAYIGDVIGHQAE